MTDNISRRTPKKRITLYNAETKKNKIIVLNPDNFKDEAELNEYCNKIKAENRAKNKEIKRKRTRSHIESVLAASDIAMPPVASIDDRMAAHTADVNVTLDDNTGNTMVIYGSSKRGKTQLLMYLYKKYYSSVDGNPNGKKFISTLFSGNPQLREYKGDKRLILAYGFSQKSADYIRMQHYINVKTKNKYKFLIMADDIIDQKHSTVLNKLILTYRNSNMSAIISLQYVYMLSKPNRSSVNHTFVFGSNTAEDEKNIIDTLLRPYLMSMGLKSYEEQMTYYRAATVNHGFIYLDNVHHKMSLHRLSLASA